MYEEYPLASSRGLAIATAKSHCLHAHQGYCIPTGRNPRN